MESTTVLPENDSLSQGIWYLPNQHGEEKYKYISTIVLSIEMELKIPEESIVDKEQIKRELEKYRNFEIRNLKQSTWIASPLWTDLEWGKELKKRGFTWQKFMVVIRDHFPYFYDWALDRISWQEVIERLIDRLKDEIADI